MITTNNPTKEQLENWYSIYMENISSLSPNRRSGTDLIQYLQKHYELNSRSDIYDPEEMKIKGLADISSSRYLSSCIPEGKTPVIKAFFLQNKGRNKKLFEEPLKDDESIWGKEIKEISVVIDETTGYFRVEGSTYLFDDLNTERGLSSEDLENFVVVAEYIEGKARLKK